MNGGVGLTTALEAAGFVVTLVTADPAEKNGVLRARRATAATATE
jgi:2-keto-3-deoxy-galactonokinase